MKKQLIYGLSKSDLLILTVSIMLIIFLQLKPVVSNLINISLEIPNESNQAAKFNDQEIQKASSDDNNYQESSKSGKEYKTGLSTQSGVLLTPTIVNLEGWVECPVLRPDVCTEECIVNPPFICGSDGKSYCTTCQACMNHDVRAYILQEESCPDLEPRL